LTVTDCESLLPALSVAVQVRVVPVVSTVWLEVEQPVVEAIPEVASVGAGQLTWTLLVYQPLLPSVPVGFGELTDGLVASRLTGTD